MIGKTIYNYLIERKIGDGGMGEVYYAKHNKVDREVAIKILHSHLFQNESIHNRFKNEANALIKLNHPNIVKIYDYVEQENFACLIMEYINGFTLDVYITKYSGPLTSAKAASIMSEVLDAVQYAHDNNIYHRDIKPGNIMISKDGNRVRIMDFGIAKLTDSVNFQTTHANTQLGTPFYMSPEQIKGLPYTRVSDIYSLGVTFFEMVTGKCPYQDIHSLFELQSKIVNEPLPLTHKYYPNVDLKIQNAIIKATQKDPKLRFQSCNEFKQFISDYNSTVISYSPIQPYKEGKTKIKISWYTYILGGIAVITLVIIIAMFARTKSGSGISKKNTVSTSIPVTKITKTSDSINLIKNIKDTKPSIQIQNINNLNDYINKKQIESNIILTQNKKDILTNKINTLDHLITSAELSLNVDPSFIPPPTVRFPTENQIRKDFKAAVEGQKELCRIIIDNYDSQVRIVSIDKRKFNLSNPPSELLLIVHLRINDAEDLTDEITCEKTLKYTRSGNEYHVENLQ